MICSADQITRTTRILPSSGVLRPRKEVVTGEVKQVHNAHDYQRFSRPPLHLVPPNPLSTPLRRNASCHSLPDWLKIAESVLANSQTRLLEMKPRPGETLSATSISRDPDVSDAEQAQPIPCFRDFLALYIAHAPHPSCPRTFTALRRPVMWPRTAFIVHLYISNLRRTRWPGSA